MAVISEVKCGRCDRRYSGFRSRCPYCGARRNKRGKHADEADNAKAKLVIGIMLLVLLIAATMVLILTSLDKVDDDSPASSPTISTDLEPTDPDSDVTGVDNTDDPNVSPSESPSPSIDIEIAEVIITNNGSAIKDNDFTLTNINDKIQLGYKTIPETDTTGQTVVWESSDEDVFMVLSNGEVTATGRGSAKVTVTVDGVVGECIVRVRGN